MDWRGTGWGNRCTVGSLLAGKCGLPSEREVHRLPSQVAGDFFVLVDISAQGNCQVRVIDAALMRKRVASLSVSRGFGRDTTLPEPASIAHAQASAGHRFPSHCIDNSPFEKKVSLFSWPGAAARHQQKKTPDFQQTRTFETQDTRLTAEVTHSGTYEVP